MNTVQGLNNVSTALRRPAARVNMFYTGMNNVKGFSLEGISMKVLIIGGVATGPKTAARLSRVEPDAEVTVVERQDQVSYAGCGMPFYIEDVIKEWGGPSLGGSGSGW